MCMPSSPSSSKDYQAEDDHRTLSRAEEIRADPTRLKGVKKHHKAMTKRFAVVGRSLSGKKR